MKIARVALIAAAVFATPAAYAEDLNVKIGVMSDMSGLYADLGGPGSVAAAKLAVEDFNPAAHGMKVESAPQIGRSGVDAIQMPILKRGIELRVDLIEIEDKMSVPKFASG